MMKVWSIKQSFFSFINLWKMQILELFMENPGLLNGNLLKNLQIYIYITFPGQKTVSRG
jgi:hypothetical protein